MIDCRRGAGGAASMYPSGVVTPDVQRRSTPGPTAGALEARSLVAPAEPRRAKAGRDHATPRQFDRKFDCTTQVGVLDAWRRQSRSLRRLRPVHPAPRQGRHTTRVHPRRVADRRVAEMRHIVADGAADAQSPR